MTIASQFAIRSRFAMVGSTDKSSGPIASTSTPRVDRDATQTRHMRRASYSMSAFRRCASSSPAVHDKRGINSSIVSSIGIDEKSAGTPGTVTAAAQYARTFSRVSENAGPRPWGCPHPPHPRLPSGSRTGHHRAGPTDARRREARRLSQRLTASSAKADPRCRLRRRGPVGACWLVEDELIEPKAASRVGDLLERARSRPGRQRPKRKQRAAERRGTRPFDSHAWFSVRACDSSASKHAAESSRASPPNAVHTSASRAVVRNMRGPTAPMRIGGRGCCNGPGAHDASRNE